MKICPECLERVEEDFNHCPDDGTELREIHARDEDPMEGRVLDEKWVLESRIGGGGMGTVYRAHQLSVDRTVAVKILRSALVEDDEHVERFFREANVASNIDDPRCVTIYDFGQTAEDHVLYLAMEYLEGRSLQDQIRERMLTFEESLQVGIQVCEALSVLHAEGVIHRDLKPENVYLVDEIGEDLFAKLLDFGLAKLAHSEETPVTATGKVFGTPTFMSPEQCMGSAVGFSSDLYALGCMLYQLVAGRTPFEGSSSVQILLGHVNRRPPPLGGPVAVPTAFDELVGDLLSKDPDQRPDSAEAVRERLEEVLQRITATTAAQTPEARGTEHTGDSGPVDETLPRRENGPDPSQAAADGGVDQTRDGVAPVYERSDEKDDRAVAKAREIEQRDSPGETAAVEGSTVRFVVAAFVFAGGLAVMWAITGPTDGSSAGESPGGPHVSSVPEFGGAVALSFGEVLRRGGGSVARAIRELPPAVGTGAASVASLARPPVDTETAGGSASEVDDAILPVLTRSGATEVLQSKNDEIKDCFERAAGDPGFDGGKLRLRLVVGESGGVDQASIASSTVERREVTSCALERARTWTFPPPPNDGRAVLLHEYAFQWKALEQGKKQKAKGK